MALFEGFFKPLPKPLQELVVSYARPLLPQELMQDMNRARDKTKRLQNKVDAMCNQVRVLMGEEKAIQNEYWKSLLNTPRPDNGIPSAIPIYYDLTPEAKSAAIQNILDLAPKAV